MTSIFRCDICGAERKEANHWFWAVPVDSRGVHSKGLGLAFYPWVVTQPVDVDVTHLCGQACAGKLLDQFVGGGGGGGGGK